MAVAQPSGLSLPNLCTERAIWFSAREVGRQHKAQGEARCVRNPVNIDDDELSPRMRATDFECLSPTPWA